MTSSSTGPAGAAPGGGRPTLPEVARKFAVHVGPRVLGAIFAVLFAACVHAGPQERAMSLVRQHRDPEAIALLREELRAHPDDIGTRKLLVRVLAASGDLPAAKLETDELSKRMPPGDPTPWIELGHAYELSHKFEEALAAYDQAADAAPNSPVGPREGWLRAARWGEAEEARPRLEEAKKRGAKDAELLHSLGLVRLHARDYDGAAAAYREGAAVEKEGVDNLVGLATVALARGDAKGALAAYDAIAQRRPTFAAAQLGRAYALARLGRTVEGKAAVDRAEELGAPPANVKKLRELLASPAAAHPPGPAPAPTTDPASPDAPE